MKSITQDYQNDKMVSSSMKSFFKEYRISNALKESNAYKSKGISVIAIFRYLFMLIFTNRSILFYYISDEMSDITWIQAFHLLMQVFLDTVTDKLSLTSEQLDQLMEAFMAALPKELKERLQLCA
ncbi:MAG TPA: hypothetical protein GXZ27_00800 [Thermoanaerobacterales bacterium]|nr:hypothetical protein [Thermoanaerobacterales bacterium]